MHLEDEMPVPLVPEKDKKAAQVNEAASPQKQGRDDTPIKPESTKDHASISRGAEKTGIVDELTSQLYADNVNWHKSMVALNRPKTPDFNPALILRVCDSALRLMQEVKAHGPLPDKMHAIFEAGSNSFLDLSRKYRVRIHEELDLMTSKDRSIEREKEINDLSALLAKLYQVEEYLRVNASTFELSSATVQKIQLNVDEGRGLEERLIHVATKKGYTLNDVDSASKMAEEESNEYNFMVTSPEQQKILTELKQKCDKLLTEIRDIFETARQKNVRLDEFTSRKMLSEKKRDLAFLERQYIRKLREKRLRNKLKAEVIVLAYLLKNPSSLTYARIDEIKDEINKIKWQTMPGYSSQ